QQAEHQGYQQLDDGQAPLAGGKRRGTHRRSSSRRADSSFSPRSALPVSCGSLPLLCQVAVSDSTPLTLAMPTARPLALAPITRKSRLEKRASSALKLANAA